MWAQLDNLTFSNIKKPDSFSIILIDIDHFKNINDTLGHQAGDAVLAKMARLIRSRLRSSDIACRYGGEEFVVILPRIKAADAYAKAEEIRKAVESYEFELKDRRHLTISAGVASYDGKVTKEDLIRFADEKLYRAKATGRNKVIL
jgi:diguanylate cyclase (GGDEF)-like protein